MHYQPEENSSDRGAEPSSPALPRPQLLTCSACSKSYSAEGARFRPFCSERCQQVDLRNWLTEAYGLPWEGGVEKHGDDFDEEDEDDWS